ncbi:MAG: hypothetical protein ACK5LZ_05650 [Anaerorhabdus sp.]
MKNKLIYFALCFSIYLGLYFIEEVALSFVITLFGISEIVRFYIVLVIAVSINVVVTWELANFIETNYLQLVELEKRQK